MDGGVVAFVFAVLIVGAFVFLAISLTGRRGHRFNTAEYQAKFLEIENRLSKDNPDSFVVAVIKCDKLLDRAMIEGGMPGKSMGDRLKRAGDKFSNLNAVWRVHKLRNAIAHEPNFDLSYRQTTSAISIYKQALKDLGAI